jgi:ketosteroid isomerase-like protein
MRTAFLANLSQDAVIFRPLPMNGHASWESRPESKATLVWEPAFAEIAASGDFGFTTGPWEFHPPAGAENTEIGYGDFLSVWQRDTTGTWRVVLDDGVEHAKPEHGLDAVTVEPGPAHDTQDTTAIATRDFVKGLDLILSRTSANLTAEHAIPMWTARDLRHLSGGHMPRLGDIAIDSLAQVARHSKWNPIDSGVARTGDLGYTYGLRVDHGPDVNQPPDTSVYVHVWRKTGPGEWKIAAVVDNPLHPEKKH